MNDQTIKLIEQLSVKLGTTAEHLWGVLMRQAPITATLDIAVSTIIAFFLWKSFRFIYRKTREDCNGCADWDEEIGAIIWGAWLAIAIIGGLCIYCEVSDALAGLANPEYWALMQIIK